MTLIRKLTIQYCSFISICSEMLKITSTNIHSIKQIYSILNLFKVHQWWNTCSEKTKLPRKFSAGANRNFIFRTEILKWNEISFKLYNTFLKITLRLIRCFQLCINAHLLSESRNEVLTLKNAYMNFNSFGCKILIKFNFF